MSALALISLRPPTSEKLIHKAYTTLRSSAGVVQLCRVNGEFRVIQPPEKVAAFHGQVQWLHSFLAYSAPDLEEGWVFGVGRPKDDSKADVQYVEG
eukprot:IDg16902t1